MDPSPASTSVTGAASTSSASAASSATLLPHEKVRSRKVNNRFVIPWEVHNRKSFSNAFKWLLQRKDLSNVPKDAQALERALPVIRPDEQALGSPPQSGMQVTWIGHATVLVQIEGLNVLTDPIFADRCSPVSFAGHKRFRSPPLPIEKLPEIHVVVISHSHYDHLSLPDILKLGNKPLYLVPLGLKAWFNQSGISHVVELDWWQEHRLIAPNGKEFLVAAVPAQHWSKRGPTDDNSTLWAGWVVCGPQNRFYFAGDTGYCGVFKQIGSAYGPFDFAAIPIGAYEPHWLMGCDHVNPQEAAWIHQDVQSKKTLGIHWGTFVLTDEFYLEPPEKLNEALEELGIDKKAFFVMRHGEVRLIDES